jgi:hypothetical protein
MSGQERDPIIETGSTHRLNAICPYFTMFPLDFPLGVLKARSRTTDWVLDPFAGRGTTNYAARVLGLQSVAIDSSPVAVALTRGKLANVSPEAIVRSAEQILRDEGTADVPSGEFWTWAYDPIVLDAVCRLRAALLGDCRSESRKALRAILLGALHGPRTKGVPSHLSNQCTRTYAPKPKYAVGFWRAHRMQPPRVSVLEVVRVRAERYFAGQPRARGTVIQGDSRRRSVLLKGMKGAQANWIVTSPPYYGMRTYIPDQWVRNWFVGGSSEVEYSNSGQLDHGCPSSFADQLRGVWSNIATVSAPSARLVVRFGGIRDRTADPLSILQSSFENSGWKLQTVKDAGSAEAGRRQARQFATRPTVPRAEYDAWACLRQS